MQRIEAFFDWLDLNRDGLKAVKAAVERSDYRMAAEALLAYYRQRDNVTYYDGWTRGDGEPHTELGRHGRGLHRDLPGGPGGGAWDDRLREQGSSH